MKILKSTVLALAIAATLSACMGTNDNARSPRGLATALDDASITAAVKSMLLADERTKGFDINVYTRKVKAQLLAHTSVAGTRIDVDTQANVVTLSGTTKTNAERLAAIRIASATRGVHHVEAGRLIVVR